MPSTPIGQSLVSIQDVVRRTLLDKARGVLFVQLLNIIDDVVFCFLVETGRPNFTFGDFKLWF